MQLFYLLNNLAGQSPFFDGVIVFFASYLPYFLVALLLVLVFFSNSPKREKGELLFVATVASVIARFGVTEIIGRGPSSTCRLRSCLLAVSGRSPPDMLLSSSRWPPRYTAITKSGGSAFSRRLCLSERAAWSPASITRLTLSEERLSVSALRTPPSLLFAESPALTDTSCLSIDRHDVSVMSVRIATY